MRLPSNTLLIILTIIGIGYNMVNYHIPKKNAFCHLDAKCISNNALINNIVAQKIKGINGLAFNYEGQSVENISILQIQFTSSGNKAIREEDIKEEISILLSGTNKIISTSIINVVPQNLSLKASIYGCSVQLSKTLMNSGDKFIVEIIATSQKNKPPFIKEINGRIEGISKIEYTTDGSFAYKDYLVEILFIAFVFFNALVFIVYSSIQRWKNRKPPS